MKTSVKMNCGPDADIIESDAQKLMHQEPNFVEEDILSSVDHDDTLVIAFEETEDHTSTEIPEVEAATQNMSTPSVNSLQPNLDSQTDSTPSDDFNDKKCLPKHKKMDKASRAGKKYVPSKKAMTDPLKMDMSKPLVTPLTSSEISLQCIECHIIFSDHRSKERHLKASHPAEYEQSILRNALFACYVCDQHFTNSIELMAHQKTHIEKNPFKCPICNQTFSKLSALSIHKKIHFGQHGYTCTQCGKPCKTLTLLKYHCRTHTGERPYVCKECGKRFTMPKALQKHMESHLPEGAQPKKEGAPSVVYNCSICKATFKSTKTRHYHMKKKHNLSKALIKTSGQLVKQCRPIITPISISQTSLLQVGCNGPLQKVDANIDTEQLRRLIESLGNVQKVNQVVILGQVPPDAPPLDIQKIAQPITLNMDLPQVDFMGMTSKNNNDTIVDPMEQTIILEPITPDGQLLNPPFSALESNVGENPVADLIFQQPMNTEQQLQTNEIICHNNAFQQNLAPGLDQTIILELTPALTPTAELEQSENVLQTEISPSTFTQNNELPIPLVEPSMSEHETSMSVQSLLSTVELELLPIQTDQHIGQVCSFGPQETLPEYQTETTTQDDTLMPTNGIDPNVQHVTEETNMVIKEAEEDTTGQILTDEPKPIDPEHIEKMDNYEEEEKGEKTVNTHVKAKQTEHPTEMPINVMSAQELVKVRKRKPPKAFFFQGYMQEFVSSIYDEFPNKTAKCKKAKKSHLVVKFGPPNKGKQSKRASKSSKQPTKDDSKEKSPTQSKVEKKSRKDKKAASSNFTAEIEVPASEDSDQVAKPKEGKNKKKKQKAESKKIEKNISVASPVFKKKQKKTIQSKGVKEKTTKNKKQKTLDKCNKQSKPESAAKSTFHIQDSLMLLKGHKQPQLKVHKLDPLKASCKAQEGLLNETQTSPKEKGSPASNEVSPENKKKGGRAKKALTLLSSLHTSKKQEETPPKPKPTRKRKASSKVETEGVITSKKPIECKDCGQRFCDVSLLQNHKATVHIVESPGITFTNGNLFEGVTGMDVYELSNKVSKDAESLNTGWDTEPEMTELDREHCVTFPALNTSPSLAVPPCEVYYKGEKDIAKAALNTSRPKVVSKSLQIEVAGKENCTDMQVQVNTDDDFKEDLLLEVDLITVGEQNDKDDASPLQDDHLPNKENELTSEGEGSAAKQTDPTLHTVSCSTRQPEIKEEEEETIIERNKNGSKRMISIESEKGEVSGEESEQTKQNDCKILYEKEALGFVPNCNQVDTHITAKTSAQRDVASNSSLERDHTEADQESSTEKTEKIQEVDDWERDPSPGIVLEKVVTAAFNSADEERSQTQDIESENQNIKVEESMTHSTKGDSRCPSDRDIRAVLVKEESRQTPQKRDHIHWNVETNSNSSSPAVQTMDCSSSIFYPVKEEEREMLVGAVECTTPVSSEANQTEHGTEDVSAPREEVTSLPGVDQFSEGQTGAEAEVETTPNLRDFLLQGSDEEDSTYELSDSHVNTEEVIMANFYKKQTTLTNQPEAGVCTVQDGSENHVTKKPIDYFSKYFNWTTWQEISHCTNKLNNLSSPVTVEEIARFVGIQIAMGTLKFPSPRLYWEDLTKVPLVADAMQLTRFLELSRLLRLSCPQASQKNSNGRKDDLISFSNGSNNRHSDLHHGKKVDSDPLWKIQHVLDHFVKGCHSLKRQGDYGIDQYPLPLTTRIHNDQPSLHCTILVNFSGMVLDLNIKLDFSDKEGVVEKIAPKASMVFLCKQELSTPAMLERLLAAGIHSAGQVGGAKGQIGDEFVSSDGKLLLRRLRCGFILSTIGNGQRNIASIIDNFEKAQISTRLIKELQNLYSIPPALFSPSHWPQTVLWYLTDLALVNSWLLYRQDARNADTPLTLLAFRLEVSKGLIFPSGLENLDSLASQTEGFHSSPSEAPNPRRLHELQLPDAATRYDGSGHWPEQLAEGEGGRCCFGDCQRTSRVLCLKCCVFLCISRNHNCFINFHSQGHQAKE